jgi:hypothetical protein
MVEFVRKRLQVFVSSTYSDLTMERQAAVEAILTAGHIPAGMELFTAGDESQMDVIKQWIDASDVFLLILGWRYGSIEPRSGKSYTQIEYEYAVSKRKPLFACVAKTPARETATARDNTADGTTSRQKLLDFRAMTLTRMVRFWEDSKDIKLSIGETLSSMSRRTDLSGWIRANQRGSILSLTGDIQNSNGLDDEPSVSQSWLYSGRALLKIEKESEATEIWVVSPHLANDTGVIYEKVAPAGSIGTIATVQENLRRNIHYTFIVPDSDSINSRLPQLYKNYGDYPGQLRVIQQSPDVFMRLAHSEIVIYNPRLEGRRPPRVFLELPVRAAHQYWIELIDDVAYTIIARVRKLVDNNSGLDESGRTT